jgi:hypothetical protein
MQAKLNSILNENKNLSQKHEDFFLKKKKKKSNG